MRRVAVEAALEFDSALRAQDVTVRLDGRTVLGPVSLEFRTGEVHGVLGHNGSGKSTLLKVLGRQVMPMSGGLALDGTPLPAWSARAFARQVAYLAQQLPTTIGLTVRELVAQGRYPWHGALGRVGPEDRRAIEAALEAAHLGPLAARVVDELSGGERQRAWVAMLVAQGSRFLLLDEPTSALDLAHQMGVLGLLRRLARDAGAGVVLALHDVNMAARFCDRITAIRGGLVLAQGTPAEIMRGDVLERIFGLPMTVLERPGAEPALGFPA